MKVLAIGAHPDDIELLCGGILAIYSELGDEVIMCHATDGDGGGLHKSREEIRKERQEEANEAAKVIGATSVGGYFHDGEIEVNLNNRLIILDVIQEHKPNVIFTHYPEDYHADHINLSKLVFEASYMTVFANRKTKREPMEKLPRLFYFDTLSGIKFSPKDYVDISKVMHLKTKMLSKHKSQLEFVKELSNVDFMDLVEVSARYRGYQCNVKYAEGFIESIVWPIEATNRILP